MRNGDISAKPSGKDLTMAVIDDIAKRASSKSDPSRKTDVDSQAEPHPLDTNLWLSHYLDRAAAAGRFSKYPAVSKLGKIKALLYYTVDLARGRQKQFNDAVVNTAHQLDHRTKYHASRIEQLEAEITALRKEAELREEVAKNADR